MSGAVPRPFDFARQWIVFYPQTRISSFLTPVFPMQWLTTASLCLASIATGMSGFLLYRSQHDQPQQDQSQSVTAPVTFGIKAYDFSTPKAALFSRLQMQLKGDDQAEREYQLLLHRREWEEQLKTLEVHDRAEHQGKVILFCSNEQEGIKNYYYVWMEKDALSGLWHFSNTFIGPAIRLPGSKEPEDPLNRKMREWNEKNQDRR